MNWFRCKWCLFVWCQPSSSHHFSLTDFLSPIFPHRTSLPIRWSSVVSSGVLCCPHPSLVCVCITTPPLSASLLVCVCLCCVFPPSQGFGLLTLQTLSLITVHNKSLRALREEFISLCSSLFFLSFPLTCFCLFSIPPSPPFLLQKLTLNTLLSFKYWRVQAFSLPLSCLLIPLW